MRVSFIYAWWWMGIFWDRRQRWLYCMFLGLGVVLKFREKYLIWNTYSKMYLGDKGMVFGKRRARVFRSREEAQNCIDPDETLVVVDG